MFPGFGCYLGGIGKYTCADRQSLAESIPRERFEIQIIRFIHCDLYHFAQNQDFNGRLDTTITESRALTNRYVITKN
jgi:hypothetical protein